MSRRYYPQQGEYDQHYDSENKADFHDTPQWSTASDDRDEKIEKTELYIGYVTIGHFYNNKPRGKAWQWKSERMLEGFLYGEVDQEGKFTGDEITFLYPDLLTGLHGKFVDGEVLEARAVDVVAERCRQGIKEIRLRLNTRDDTLWRAEHSSSDQILSYTKTLGNNNILSLVSVAVDGIGWLENCRWWCGVVFVAENVSRCQIPTRGSQSTFPPRPSPELRTESSPGELSTPGTSCLILTGSA